MTDKPSRNKAKQSTNNDVRKEIPEHRRVNPE